MVPTIFECQCNFESSGESFDEVTNQKSQLTTYGGNIASELNAALRTPSQDSLHALLDRWWFSE
jgi:hypothetical protein